jgi:hypothetical protein
MDTEITAGHIDIKTVTILLLRQGCTNLERLVYYAIKFCAVAFNISSRIIAVLYLHSKTWFISHACVEYKASGSRDAHSLFQNLGS